MYDRCVVVLYFNGGVISVLSHGILTWLPYSDVEMYTLSVLLHCILTCLSLREGDTLI